VFLVMLDSNIMGAANQRDIDWLRNELQSEYALRANWRVAVMHHPMWPAASIPRDIMRAETMREFFLPVLEEYGVELILCGHQHVYSRSAPMRGDDAAVDGQGIVQIMAASGDKASYALSESGYIVASASAPCYLHLLADGETITITSFNAGHEEIDSITIRKA
jgi:3',5'-cyclic AMP phosphodiesterase CpdA